MVEKQDIVQQLRAYDSGNVYVTTIDSITEEAADEIEKLRNTILYALDCLGHDDVEGAKRALSTLSRGEVKYHG